MEGLGEGKVGWECGEEFEAERVDWGWVREEERTTDRARLSRGELLATWPRSEEERGEWSLLTREERLGEAFSWIFVREQFSFGFAGELDAGRLVALKAEDLGVETEEETVRGEKLVEVLLARE